MKIKGENVDGAAVQFCIKVQARTLDKMIGPLFG